MIYDADWKNETVFATCGEDKLIKIWDLTSNTPLSVLGGHTGTIMHLKWDMAGTLLASSSEDNTAKV